MPPSQPWTGLYCRPGASWQRRRAPGGTQAVAHGGRPGRGGVVCRALRLRAGGDFAAPLFLLGKICSSSLPGCCYINRSAASRCLLSRALTPRSYPGSETCCQPGEEASGGGGGGGCPTTAAWGLVWLCCSIPAATSARQQVCPEGWAGVRCEMCPPRGNPSLPASRASLARTASQPAPGISVLKFLLPGPFTWLGPSQPLGASFWHHLLQEGPQGCVGGPPATGLHTLSRDGGALWVPRVRL